MAIMTKPKADAGMRAAPLILFPRGDTGSSPISARPPGISDAASYILAQFLEEEHYSSLHTVLAKLWASWRPITAIKKIAEQHGVVISNDEDELLLEMGTQGMTDEIIKRIPKLSEDQKDQFICQVQLIMSTADCVQAALDKRNPIDIDQVLTDANEIGISPHVSKVAFAQVGTQAATLNQRHETFVKKSADQIKALMDSLHGAMEIQKQLGSMQTQLIRIQTQQREKAKKTMINFAGKSQEALMGCSFSGWKNLMETLRTEAALAEEYQGRINHFNEKFIFYKLQKMENTRRMFARNTEFAGLAMCKMCFEALQVAVSDAKRAAEEAARQEEAARRLAAYAAEQLKQANQVMSRMMASTTTSLLGMCIVEWKKHVNECKRNRELEAKQRAEELAAADFMRNKNENTKKLISRMTVAWSGATSELVFGQWKNFVREERIEREKQAILDKARARMKEFWARNKGLAVGANSSASDIHKYGMALHSIVLWREVATITRVQRIWTLKDEEATRQLGSVLGSITNIDQQLA